MTRSRAARGAPGARGGAARAALLALAVATPWLGGCSLQRALSVGTGFAAHVVCSLAHDSGQDPERVVREYVVHETAPLGLLLSVSTGADDARASALGVHAHAIYRSGLGCTLLDGEAPRERLVLPEGYTVPRPALDPAVAWPYGAGGGAAPGPAAVEAAIDRAFAEPGPASGHVRNTTAVVIAHDGHLVAERYRTGYGPETPMLSWSMAKSVTAALIGILVGDGRLALQAPAPVPEWSAPDDPRHPITLDMLLRMSSGLSFDETYGATNDVSVMLFTKPDVGAFAASQPLVAPPDTVWHYSSGTANIVARMIRDLFGGDLAAQVRFSRERLFDAANMASAFAEPDVSGSFIGSSFVFMTARDWARFGELHRRDGVWNGRRLLPEGWVRYVTTPTPAAPEGQYGAHWWLNAGDPADPARRPWPTLPRDAYAARGHSGQWVVVVPSARLVVVRLGLSLPDDGLDGTEELVADVLRALAPSGGARSGGG